MRAIAFATLLFVGCSSADDFVAPGGTPPVDVQVGGIELQYAPTGVRSPTTTSRADEPFARSAERTQMLVSIMNVSDRDVTIERIDISPTGGRARVEQMTHRLMRRIDPGESIEVNVPVQVSLGGGSLGGNTVYARMRVRLVMLSGDVWPLEFEVPVYERR